MEIQPDKILISEQALIYGVASLTEVRERIVACTNNIVGMKDICAASFEGDIKGNFYRAMKSVDDRMESTMGTFQTLEDVLYGYMAAAKLIDDNAYVVAGGK